MKKVTNLGSNHKYATQYLWGWAGSTFILENYRSDFSCTELLDGIRRANVDIQTHSKQIIAICFILFPSIMSAFRQEKRDWSLTRGETVGWLNDRRYGIFHSWDHLMCIPTVCLGTLIAFCETHWEPQEFITKPNYASGSLRLSADKAGDWNTPGWLIKFCLEFCWPLFVNAMIAIPIISF